MRRPRRPAFAPGGVQQLGEGHWLIRLECELKSPNKTLWAHWRVKHRERQLWEDSLTHAAAGYAGVTTAAGLAMVKRSLSLFVPAGVVERRWIAVVREVPSTRHFIRDDDNLGYAAKFLVDAMKRIGMIVDDKRELLSLRPPVQRVSADRQFHTLIEISRVPLAEAGPGGLYV